MLRLIILGSLADAARACACKLLVLRGLLLCHGGALIWHALIALVLAICRIRTLWLKAAHEAWGAGG